MAIVKSNIYKASYEDLTELSCSAATMKGALSSLAKEKDDEPVQLRRMAKGIRQVEDDKPVTINATVEGNGNVYPPTAQVDVDTPFYFYAVANAHSTFDHWEDAEGKELSRDAEFAYTPAEVEAGQTITLKAIFTAETPITITFAVDPEGSGTLTTTEEHGYAHSTFLNKATPAEGYDFAGWYYADGSLAYRYPELEITLDEDTTLTARFIAKAQHEIATIVDTPAGTTAYAVPGTIDAYEGEKVNLYAVPTDTANFDHWEDEDGGNLGSDNPLVYTVTSDTSSSIIFKAVFTEV